MLGTKDDPCMHLFITVIGRFNLLSRMLSKQPHGMPLLTGQTTLPSLLNLTYAALQVPSPDVVLQATLALANLLRYTLYSR